MGGIHPRKRASDLGAALANITQAGGIRKIQT